MSERLHRVNPVMRERARQLRKEMTPVERIMWAQLRDRRFEGLRFRRQHPTGPYIVDFYCAERQLVIEIDGDSHAVNTESDNSRTRRLQEHGCRVIRFTNHDVVNNLDGVLQAIKSACLQEKAA